MTTAFAGAARERVERVQVGLRPVRRGAPVSADEGLIDQLMRLSAADVVAFGVRFDELQARVARDDQTLRQQHRDVHAAGGDAAHADSTRSYHSRPSPTTSDRGPTSRSIRDESREKRSGRAGPCGVCTDPRR